MAHLTAQSDEHLRRPADHHVPGMASRSVSFDTGVRSEDSWVEISSQPSSSSLSSINDEIITTGLRVQHDSAPRRRRLLRPTARSGLHVLARSTSVGTTSSQDEYEESESESDRVMTSSGEVPKAHARGVSAPQTPATGGARVLAESSEDENRTAVIYTLGNNDACFTPQPNAFSHPPSTGHARIASQPDTGSYFPSQRLVTPKTAARHLMPASHDESRQHMPQNILSPSYNAALQHDEALRASLSTLLSCAAAARGLKGDTDKRLQTTAPQPRSTRIEPVSFRLVPESALPVEPRPAHLEGLEPLFKPTLRRTSTSTTSTSAQNLSLPQPRHPTRRPRPREQSKDRTSPRKKPRRSSSLDDLSPTLLTWVASVGVVVVLSALSFSAGYAVGKEAGLLEASEIGVVGARGDEVARGCAREAVGRSMGLRRSLAREAVRV